MRLQKKKKKKKKNPKIVGFVDNFADFIFISMPRP